MQREKLRVLVAPIENRGFVRDDFWMSVNGQKFDRGMEVESKFFDGPHQAEMRNAAVEHALEGNFTHVLMMDTDMQYTENTLLDLLAADVDVVCGFSVSAGTPHSPIFGRKPENPLTPYSWVRAWPTTTGKLDGKPLVGLQQSHIVGGAGLLIRTSALRKLTKPWFDFSRDDKGDLVGEDCWFSKQCRDAGIALHVHTGVVVGHVMNASVWPVPDRDAGVWKPKYIVRPTAQEAARRAEEAQIIEAEEEAQERDRDRLDAMADRWGASNPPTRAPAEEIPEETPEKVPEKTRERKPGTILSIEDQLRKASEALEQRPPEEAPGG